MPNAPENLHVLLERLLASPALQRHSSPHTYPRGALLIRQGDVCRDVFVLRRGLLKMFYITHDGKEWVKSFFMDGGLFGSRRSQAMGLGSAFAVMCLEECEILRLPYELVRQCAREDRVVMEGLFDFSEWVSLRKEKREHELLCLSAEARYRLFLAEDGALAARLTQVDIARYLGITPIALSRIKRRLQAG